jgi:hypothetical protein
MESRHEIRRPVAKYEQLSNFRALLDRVGGLRREGASAERIAEQLNRDGFLPPHGPCRFNRHMVIQFLSSHGLPSPGLGRRLGPEDLGPDEWRLGDLAEELGISCETMRVWRRRGWVLGRQAGDRHRCWVLWADVQELERLGRLRDWRRGGYRKVRPEELTTPRREGREQASEDRQRRRSGRGPDEGGQVAAKDDQARMP